MQLRLINVPDCNTEVFFVMLWTRIWYKNPEYVKPLFNGCSEAFDIAAKVLADHRDIGLDAENGHQTSKSVLSGCSMWADKLTELTDFQEFKLLSN